MLERRGYKSRDEKDSAPTDRKTPRVDAALECSAQAPLSDGSVSLLVDAVDEVLHLRAAHSCRLLEVVACLLAYAACSHGYVCISCMHVCACISCMHACMCSIPASAQSLQAATP